MTLEQLFDGIDEVPENIRQREVCGVTSDSREVQPGFLFVCVEGRSFDGHSAAAEMLKKGACAVVTQRRLGLAEEITVQDSRRLYPELLSAFYGRPTRRISLGAVTGTNGKTTIANLCAQITRALGKQTGVIGTVGCDTGRGLEYSHSGPPTTPEPRRLYQLFREMADIGTEYCFLEASSQALAQHRFAAERFRAGAFTNLTQDHLDYHGTMEEYYKAKRMLMDMSDAAVINIDDEYGARTLEYCRSRGIPAVSTSVKGEADFFAEFIKLKPHGAEFLLTCPARQKSWVAHIPLTGLYNVSNAVQAAVMVNLMGFPMEDVLAALEKSPGVSGRLETVYQGEFTVIRDYAHTEDGLDKLLSTLKPLTKGRLIVLFGAADERDAGHPPAHPKAAAQWGDNLYITTDSPRHEDPQQTINGVKAGVPEGIEYEEFIDRKAAIFRALEMAQPGDMVALCGKGHEDYQAIGDEYLHFDEREIVAEWLNTHR